MDIAKIELLKNILSETSNQVNLNLGYLDMISKNAEKIKTAMHSHPISYYNDNIEKVSKIFGGTDNLLKGKGTGLMTNVQELNKHLENLNKNYKDKYYKRVIPVLEKLHKLLLEFYKDLPSTFSSRIKKVEKEYTKAIRESINMIKGTNGIIFGTVVSLDKTRNGQVSISAAKIYFDKELSVYYTFAKKAQEYEVNILAMAAYIVNVANEIMLKKGSMTRAFMSEKSKSKMDDQLKQIKEIHREWNKLDNFRGVTKDNIDNFTKALDKTSKLFVKAAEVVATAQLAVIIREKYKGGIENLEGATKNIKSSFDHISEQIRSK